MNKQEAYENVIKNPMSREAWQKCGKACGWGNKCPNCDSIANGLCSEHKYKRWESVALQFHEINLTQGFDKAVQWLEELVTS